MGLLLAMDENEVTARKPSARSNEAKWADIELSSGYRLSQEASQRIETKLLMAWNEKIELDGRVMCIDLEHDCAEIEINYSTSHPGFFQGMFGLRYVISRDEIKESLNRPCTLWNRQNMQESLRRMEEKMKRWVTAPGTSPLRDSNAFVPEAPLSDRLCRHAAPPGD